MIVSIHQPNFLPWLGYFHRIAESDVHVILDNVQFEKNSFINRNRIKIASGWMWLTVPVFTKGRFGRNPIDQVLIDSKTRWSEKIWKSIWLNYSRAPFFKNYFEPLAEILKEPREKLVELNLALLYLLLKALSLEVKVIRASELKLEEKKSDLVLAVCEALKATVYFSGPLGRGYLEEDKFKARGIKVVYQEYRHPVYNQLFGDFISNLSIIDLLFNCGAESLDILKRGQQKMEGGG